MTIINPDRPVSEIVKTLFGQIRTLTRNEAKLARAEMAEKLSGLVGSLAVALIGAVLLLPALVILLEAAVAALSRAGIRHEWSALIVGSVVLIVGGAFLTIGINRVKAANLLPDKIFHQLQRDVAVAKLARQDHDKRAA